MNGKQLKKIILEELHKVLNEEEKIEKTARGNIFAALGFLHQYYLIKAKEPNQKNAAISGMVDLLQYSGSNNPNPPLKDKMALFALNEMKSSSDDELYVYYLRLGTENIEQIKQLSKSQPQQSVQQQTQTAVNIELPATRITSVKKEGNYYIVTVVSDQYPGLIGTGKAKFRGDMDFARDSAAAQARKDLALKIQGQK